MKSIIKALEENPEKEITLTGTQLAELVDECRQDAEHRQYHCLIDMDTKSIERELYHFDQDERCPFMRHINANIYRCAWQQLGNTILPVKAAKLYEVLIETQHRTAYKITWELYSRKNGPQPPPQTRNGEFSAEQNQTMELKMDEMDEDDFPF
jgi:hypothetical protein